MTHKIGGLLLAVAMIMAGAAQGQSRRDKYIKSHIGVGLHGGLGRVLTVPHGETTLGMTLGLDADYSYLLTEHFGVKAGVGFSYCKSSLDAEDLTSRPTKLTTITTSGGETQLMAKYQCVTTRAREYYTMAFAEIPLMLMIQGTPMDFSIEQFHSCYFALGVKTAIPVSCNAKTEYSSTKVFIGKEIPGSGITLDDYLQVENYEPEKQSYSMSDAGNMLYFMLAAEGGVTLKFNDAGEMVFALFADYAINHSTTDNPADASPIASSGDQFVTNGYLKSSYVSMFKYFKVGLKIQYNFNW